MIIGIPMMQLILFGYAINADPKNLPTAVRGIVARSMIAALENTGYSHVVQAGGGKRGLGAAAPMTGLVMTRERVRSTLD